MTVSWMTRSPATRGAASLELVGVIAVVAILVLSLLGAAGAWGGDLSQKVDRVVCEVSGGDSCGGPGAVASTRGARSTVEGGAWPAPTGKAAGGLTGRQLSAQGATTPATPKWCFARDQSEVCADATGRVSYCEAAGCPNPNPVVPLSFFDTCVDVVGAPVPGTQDCTILGDGTGDYVVRCNEGDVGTCRDLALVRAAGAAGAQPTEPLRGPRRGLATDEPRTLVGEPLATALGADDQPDWLPGDPTSIHPVVGVAAVDRRTVSDEYTEGDRRPRDGLKDVVDHGGRLLQTLRCGTGINGIDGRGRSVRINYQRGPMSAGQNGHYNADNGVITLRDGSDTRQDSNGKQALSHELGHALTGPFGLRVFPTGGIRDEAGDTGPLDEGFATGPLDEGFAMLTTRNAAIGLPETFPDDPLLEEVRIADAKDADEFGDDARYLADYDPDTTPLGLTYRFGYLVIPIYDALDGLIPDAVAAAMAPFDGCPGDTVDPVERWWGDSLATLSDSGSSPGFTEWCEAMAQTSGPYQVTPTNVRMTFRSFGVPCGTEADGPIGTRSGADGNAGSGSESEDEGSSGSDADPRPKRPRSEDGAGSDKPTPKKPLTAPEGWHVPTAIAALIAGLGGNPSKPGSQELAVQTAATIAAILALLAV